jgi:hypothetical protein
VLLLVQQLLAFLLVLAAQLPVLLLPVALGLQGAPLLLAPAC